MMNFYLRLAVPEDKETLLKLARLYRNELGYLHPIALTEHIQKGTVILCVWRDTQQVCGFVDYHAGKKWNTVYHLAVHRDFTRKDIGRALLYAVPCPIRLKCTIDNPANLFYKAAGMCFMGTETGKKRALNVWELRVLYQIIQGNNRKIPMIAKQSGMAYGTRHVEKPRAWPFALDIRWKEYDWQQYLSLVETYRPVQVLVADYEQPDQQETMLQQVADLRRLGVLRILVCPKFDTAIADIPSDCIIAISVPSDYAGYVPPLTQLSGKRVHLLGGSPGRQKRMTVQIQGIGGKVISMDGNGFTKVARTGNYWDNGWKKDKWRTSEFFYATCLLSARNIQREMQSLYGIQQFPLF